ncbi:MAG: exo-alpha-sialidase [Anaerolineae bacterium]|nr:exo-alpha-sialidase [Anaerolineae bacterium]
MPLKTINHRSAFICALAALCLIGGFIAPARTRAAPQLQTAEPPWTEPVNLSRSGAASQPKLLFGPDNLRQAFWWDRFDGIITSINPGATWSAPARAPIILTELVGVGDNTAFVSNPINAMPNIIGDNAGTAHAFWLGAPDEDTDLRPLLTSRLVLSTTTWTPPAAVAPSALKWDMAAGADGTLHLVYLRTTHSDAAPAGIVYLRSTNNGVTWSTPVSLYTSIYFRLLTAETAQIQVLADGTGTVLVTSQTVRPSQPFILRSTDAGVTWEPPYFIENEDLQPVRADVILVQPGSITEEGDVASSDLLLVFQSLDERGACLLFQQRSAGSGATWTAPEPILEGSPTCAQPATFLPAADGSLLRITGAAAEGLTLEVWDPAVAQWSEPQSLDLAFDHPGVDPPLALTAVNLYWLDGQLTVIATGDDGEIWFLQSDLDLTEWAFAPPSPWSEPINIAGRPGLPGLPSVAPDTEGRVHVLWSEAPDASQPGTTLLYARWDGTRWSTPAVLRQDAYAIGARPALIVAGDWLHAVWSSGPAGTIYTSHAYLRDAVAAANWSEPLALSTPGEDEQSTGSASAPAIAVDLLGRLRVTYAVPVNDGRGIYVTASSDAGETWSAPVQVFDTVAEGWLRADHPSLTVDEYGGLHITWLRAPLPGNGLPEAVYYARSTDLGETWSEPFLLAEGAFTGPQLIANLHGQLFAFWRDLRQDIVRYRTSVDGGEVWDTISTIPGFRAVTGPAGLTLDGSGALHAAALTRTSQGSSLLYSVWQDGRWQAAQPALALPADLDPPSGAALSGATAGAALAVQGSAGRIDVLLPAAAAGAGLWSVTRHIEPINAAPASFITPEPTVTPTPSPTPLPSPTPRPTVAPEAGDPGVPVLEVGPLSQPLSAVWGILIAVIAVAAVLLRQGLKH